jgi:hypothetical protein
MVSNGARARKCSVTGSPPAVAVRRRQSARPALQSAGFCRPRCRCRCLAARTRWAGRRLTGGKADAHAAAYPAGPVIRALLQRRQAHPALAARSVSSCVSSTGRLTLCGEPKAVGSGRGRWQ